MININFILLHNLGLSIFSEVYLLWSLSKKNHVGGFLNWFGHQWAKGSISYNSVFSFLIVFSCFILALLFMKVKTEPLSFDLVIIYFANVLQILDRRILISGRMTMTGNSLSLMIHLFATWYFQCSELLVISNFNYDFS